MRSLMPAWPACLCAVALALADPRADAEPLNTTRIASALNLPLYLTWAPGDPYRVYVVEKRGRIKILDLRNPAAAPITFLDIDARVFTPTGVNDERGMLGLAFHPDYADNGFFYINYINLSGDTVIARLSRLTADSGDPSALNEVVVLTVDQPDDNHNGGWLAFGPNDGYFYAALGDGGGQGDTGNRAQDTTSMLLGKILRLDVDGDDFPMDATRNYAIPPTNPFVGVSGDDEIWSFGLRNPWRNSFDRETGDFYVADVGQSNWEEVNFQPASSPGGVNYGWRCYEGNVLYNNIPACTGTLTFPFHVFGHSESPFGCAVTGGYVYRGCAIPQIFGHYFFTDFCAADVWSLVYTGVGSPPYTDFTDRTSDLTPPVGSLVNLASFGEDFFGEIYLIRQSSVSGEVFKIIPETAAQDCNANNVADCNEIEKGLLADVNQNGIADICGPCPGDANADRFVNFADALAILALFGADYSPETGLGDVDGSGVVDFDDVLFLLANFGFPCP